ncbi:MAG TPA: T9SS type A sorting domain-containing protein, partial [Bacteroidota bacterium]|nr:T9SS type A sorting domain-containing protein [Bacteroidota bacterium]
AAPKAFTLHPNYPNPFNPSTSIEFTIPEDGFATLKVFNLLGQEVATLFEGEAVAGQIYQRTFDASQLPTGVYVSRLTSGGRSLIQKMLLAK